MFGLLPNKDKRAVCKSTIIQNSVETPFGNIEIPNSKLEKLSYRRQMVHNLDEFHEFVLQNNGNQIISKEKAKASKVQIL